MGFFADLWEYRLKPLLKGIWEIFAGILDGMMYESESEKTGFLGNGSQGLLKQKDSDFFKTPAQKKKEKSGKRKSRFSMKDENGESNLMEGVGPMEHGEGGDHGGGGGEGGGGGGGGDHGGEGMVGASDHTVYQHGSDVGGIEISAPEGGGGGKGSEVGAPEGFGTAEVGSKVDEEGNWRALVEQTRNLVSAGHGGHEM